MTSTSELKLSSPPPSLPMPSTTKRLGLSGSRQIERAEVFFHFRPAEPVGSVQRRIGQRRQLAHGFFHGHRRHQIARADAQILALFVPAQGGAEMPRIDLAFIDDR